MLGGKLFARLWAALVALAVLTSACTAAQPDVAPLPTPGTPAPPELDRRAEAALALPWNFESLAGEEDLGGAGWRGLGMAADGQAIGEVCGILLRLDGVTSAARTRAWSGAFSLFERVHVTAARPARELLADVRRQVHECGRPAGEVTAGVPFTYPVAVEESYAYCEADAPGTTGWTCRAALAHGTVFAFVLVSGLNEDFARKNLTNTVSIFAMHLTSA
ncbi:hypothetical protein [Nocardia sp. NRRL S-836]|uniref:hypothetical protein n=1 Tax=Nocardia sp. NRRL S-836 TaxID=1519492 RepID=UPI0006AE4D7D|nr:hypothetical protein [Nocardia sp. NRRL S-836]KOV80859.1 hypothetical protein ADL03_31235 [Nocardia sp. NRRL S-836]